MPSGPRSGEAITARVPRPFSRARRDDALEDLAVDRRVADDAMVRPAAAGLELRLDQRDDVAGRCRAERGSDRPEDERKRDERDVDRGDGDRLGKGRRGERACVGPLHRDDPGILPERLGQLAPTDIEGVDADGAALEEDVGEAPGRGADIERDHPARVDLERIQRRRQLVATATDIGLRFGHADGRVRGDHVARLAVVPGSVALPHPDRAGQHERLRTAARLDQSALDEQLIEPDALDLRFGRWLGGRGWAHPPIVAQAASRGITRVVRLARPPMSRAVKAAASIAAWRSPGRSSPRDRASDAAADLQLGDDVRRLRVDAGLT